MPCRRPIYWVFACDRRPAIRIAALPSRPFSTVERHHEASLADRAVLEYLLGAGGNCPAAEAAPEFKMPESVIVEADVEYGRAGDRSLKLDSLGPRTKGTKILPVVVNIHGGGWQQGNKESGRRWLSYFVASGNFVGVTVGYRLTGEAIWPAQIHDCKAAIRWIRANAEKYRIWRKLAPATPPEATWSHCSAPRAMSRNWKATTAVPAIPAACSAWPTNVAPATSCISSTRRGTAANRPSPSYLAVRRPNMRRRQKLPRRSVGSRPVIRRSSFSMALKTTLCRLPKASRSPPRSRKPACR